MNAEIQAVRREVEEWKEKGGGDKPRLTKNLGRK